MLMSLRLVRNFSVIFLFVSSDGVVKYENTYRLFYLWNCRIFLMIESILNWRTYKLSTIPLNKFWVTVTAVITIGLLAYLLPLLLDKYGLVKAVLLACLIPVAMAMAYIRGYWISKLIDKKRKKD